MTFSIGRKQVAVIHFGGGLDSRAAVTSYRHAGRLVVFEGEFAFVYEVSA